MNAVPREHISREHIPREHVSREQTQSRTQRPAIVRVCVCSRSGGDLG